MAFKSTNQLQGLQTARSLTISESLVNTTNSLLYVLYELTLENTSTGCEKVYDYNIGVKPQFSISLNSNINTTFQTVCEGETIDRIAYEVMVFQIIIQLIGRNKMQIQIGFLQHSMESIKTEIMILLKYKAL